MTYLLSHFWTWIAGAFVLGGLIGATTWSQHQDRKVLPGWLVMGLLLFAAGVGAAGARTLAGRAGLWLEIALMLFPAYLLGCLVGVVLRSLFAAPAPVAGGLAAATAHAAAHGVAHATPVAVQAAEPVAPVIQQKRESAPLTDAASSIAAAAPVAAPAAAAAAVVAATAPVIGSAISAQSGSATPPPLAPLVAPPPQPGHVYDRHPGRQPSPDANAARDDLARIRGLSAQDIQRLNAARITSFRQIADLTPENVEWLDSYVGANGRIERDQWRGQARYLADAARQELAAQSNLNRTPAVAQAGYNAGQNAGPGESQPLRPVAQPSASRIASAPASEPAGAPVSGSVSELASGSASGLQSGSASESASGFASGSSGHSPRETARGPAGASSSAADATIAAATATALAAMTANQHAEWVVPVAANLGDIDGKHPGARPVGLARPRGDRPDDLLKIKGVGRANIQQLHALGIFHFDQIANWSRDEQRWVGSFLAYPGRLDKEDWPGQAKFYAKRLEIEIANRAATERYRKE